MASMIEAKGIGGKGTGSIKITEAPIPEPGPGEALVHLRAEMLNYRD